MVKDTPIDETTMTKRELQDELRACRRRHAGAMDLVRRRERMIVRWAKYDGTPPIGEIEDFLSEYHCPSCQRRNNQHEEDCAL